MTSLEQDLADAGMKPIDDARGTAKALGASLKVLYSMNEQGMPRVRAGGTLRYSRREVAAYLEASRRGSQPADVAVGQPART